ncbi:MAG: hypothetical protein V1777_04575 [Candidatus Micrarchaeota archaeon]
MADIIELGLFLYSLAGSASIGYWILTSFWPSIRDRDRQFKTGLSVVVGGLYILLVFLIASFLGAGHYNGWSFVQAFFWLVPVSFIVLVSILLVKHMVLVGRQIQSGEINLFAPKIEIAAETMPLQGSAELVSELASTVPEIEKTEVPSPSVSSEEVLPKSDSKKSAADSSVPVSEVVPGENEEDVASEIKKIMSAGRFEDQSKPAETDEKKQESKTADWSFEVKNEMNSDSQKTGLTQEEIEKIKADLKKKIKDSLGP